jgi:hypothetical protein
MDPTCHPLFSFLSLFSPSHRACPTTAAPATPPYAALSSTPSPVRRATRCRQRTLEVCPELASLPQEGPGGLPQIPYAHPRGPTPDSDTLEGPPYSPTVVVLLELIHGGPLELHLESSP